MHTADYEEPGKWSAMLLAVLMHVLLATALLVSVKWQTRPQAVVAELWTPQDMPRVREAPPPPPPPPPEPVPVHETPRPSPPVVAPEPPRPLQPPPQIKLKAEKKPEKAAKKPEKKVEKAKEKPQAKEVPKPAPEAAKPGKGPVFDDLLAREENQLNRTKAEQDRQRRLEDESRLLKLAREERESQARAAAKAKAQADYTARLQGKIRGNMVPPPNLKGNPTALFAVTQLPSGEVLEVKLRRSSGNPLYDDAVERAIRKSSPLPRPDDPSVFSRELLLTYCPDEERGCSR